MLPLSSLLPHASELRTKVRDKEKTNEQIKPAHAQNFKEVIK